MDMADIMIGLKPNLTFDNWLSLLNKYGNNLYIQSKNKKLHIKTEDKLYELYFIEQLGRYDYFKLLELCSSPIKVTVNNIKEHSYTQLDSYYGISVDIIALNYEVMEHDIFYIKPNNEFDNNHVHNPINENEIDLSSVSIIEERYDYIYFKMGDLFFEAKEIVGSFNVYCGSKNIFTAKNKNDVLKQAQSHLDIINNKKEE